MADRSISLADRRMHVALSFALLLGAWFVAVRNPLLLLMGQITNSNGIFTPYVATLNGLNYFDDGFARRAAAGTIMKLVTGGVDDRSFIVLSIITAASAALSYALILRAASQKGGRGLWWPAMVACVSPQLFLGWGTDPGRVDMAIVAAIAGAALAAHHGRWLVATALLSVGLLFHETSVIFGWPLVVAILATRTRSEHSSTAGPAQIAAFTAATATSVLAILIAQSLFSAPPDKLAHTMLARSSADESAAFLTIAGVRGIRASLCQAYSTSAAFLYVAASCCMLFASFIILLYRRSEAAVFVLATLLPFLLVCMVAIDFGRWLKFGWNNAWILSAIMAIDGPTRFVVPNRRYLIAAATLILLLALRPTGVDVPSRVIAGWVQDGRGFYLRPLDECDPTWRDLVHHPDR